MVNNDVRSAERELAVRYAPAAARAGLGALLALDDRLGAIVRGTRDAVTAQLKLTWWFEALERLDTAPPPAEPVLTALAREVLPAGVAGAALAAMVDGWERLLVAEPLDDAALIAFGSERGGRLFAAAAAVLGGADPRIPMLGEGWALADLARRSTEPAAAARAAAFGGERLDVAFAGAWPRRLRALGALGLLARADLRDDSPGGAKRVARLLFHRLTGR